MHSKYRRLLITPRALILRADKSVVIQFQRKRGKQTDLRSFSTADENILTVLGVNRVLKARC